jgi:hypothetical protein
MASPPVPDAADRSAAEVARRRLRGRNIAVALALVAWVALIYVISLVKMGGS